MNIDTIENGYVIDHIKTGNAMKIYSLLELSNITSGVALITNAKSKKSTKKDIIKIAELIDLDFDKLAGIDPDVTVNIVKDNVIIEKKKLEVPKIITNIYNCKNPRCITSIERGIDQVFILTDEESKTYRCKYCETKLEK